MNTSHQSAKGQVGLVSLLVMILATTNVAGECAARADSFDASEVEMRAREFVEARVKHLYRVDSGDALVTPKASSSWPVTRVPIGAICGKSLDGDIHAVVVEVLSASHLTIRHTVAVSRSGDVFSLSDDAGFSRVAALLVGTCRQEDLVGPLALLYLRLLRHPEDGEWRPAAMCAWSMAPTRSSECATPVVQQNELGLQLDVRISDVPSERASESEHWTFILERNGRFTAAKAPQRE